MKVMLGVLARADRAQEPFLDRVLSIMSPAFDEVTIVDDGGRPIADYSAQRNRLIDIAERGGFDWMIQLDSDECMFPADIDVVKAMMTPQNRLIVLPRIELVRDFGHYDPSVYPDYQGRAFRLGIGYRFRRPLHEGLYRRFSPLSEMRLKRGARSDTTPIYHYGRVGETDRMLLKYHNYALLAKGQAPVDELPAGMDAGDRAHLFGEMTPFDGPHPLAGL